MKNCTVCDTPVSDKFLSSCGQELSNRKTTFISLILDFFSNFFSIDKSFIGTSRRLLADPQFMVENFYNGNKRYFLSPGSFILYAITGIAIHTAFFGASIWGIDFMLDEFPLQYTLVFGLIPIISFCSVKIQTDKKMQEISDIINQSSENNDLNK